MTVPLSEAVTTPPDSPAIESNEQLDAPDGRPEAVGEGLDAPDERPEAVGEELDAVAERLDGTVVGIGEATHGSRELVALRARLTAAMIARGARAVALEAGAGSVLPLDEYVTHGGGELADALERLPSFWQTAAFAAFCRWLRRYNGSHAPAGRVRLVGVDVDDPTPALAAVRASLRRGEATGVGRIDGLDRLVDTPGSLTGRVSATRIDSAERVVTGLTDLLTTVTADQLAADGRSLAELRYLLETVGRTVGWLRAGGASESFEPAAMAERDRVMAANAADLAGRFDRTVFWAHNWHVKRGSFGGSTEWGDQPTAGDRLADRFGPEYRTVATDFAHGGFRAGTPDSDGLVACRVESPVAGSVAARLGATAPAFTEPTTGERVRRVGLSFDPNGPPKTDDAAAFDGVIGLQTTTPTRPFEGL